MNDQPKNVMDCTDIKALLSALLDDRIDAEGRYRAERHLGECKACRDLLSKAERNDALIAAGAGGFPSLERLPEGFETAVLSRTVHADRRRAAANRWTSWLGWLAAAACLFLAVSVWRLDRQATMTETSSEAAGPLPELVKVAYAAGPEIRSWTLEGELPAGTVQQLRGATADPTGRDEPLLARHEASPAATPPPPPRIGAAEHGGEPATISRDDAETLDAASLLLAMLEQGNDQSFADVEQVRRIIEYDELLPRLAHARRNLSAPKRPAVLATESVLYRIAHGPLNLEEVRELRDIVARLDLPEQIDAISGQEPFTSSL
ncbi:MAG: anti-sigma factor family protein [Planctomycetota bacterium]|jgi:hypothetical protein